MGAGPDPPMSPDQARRIRAILETAARRVETPCEPV